MLLDPWDVVQGFRDSPATGRLYIGFGAALAAGVYATLVYTSVAAMLAGFDQSVRQLSGTK
jgi:hypothetical protein